MFVFLFAFMVLWVMFSIYALLFSLHRICVFNMHTFLCYYASMNACSDDHLIYYVIIVVISMTVLVYNQVVHMFYIMFTWSQIMNACSNDHLIYYVIIVVISIWLFWCIIKLLTCFISCLLDRNLLVMLYLYFYYLLYVESLMCFVQVFQVTSMYVSSSSQLLWFMIGGVIW